MNGTESKEHQTAGQLAVLSAAFLWSTSGLFIKLIDWHPLTIAGTRSFISTIFLLIIRVIAPPPKEAKNPPAALWAGAVIYALTMITFILANKLTSAANAILLQYGAPVWAAILGWIMLKEKPRKEHWIALVMVSGGLVIFFMDGLSSGGLWGDGIAIFSGVLFGSHAVFLRMMKDGHPQDSFLLAHAISACIGIPFIILYPPAISAVSALEIIYLGIIQVGLASVLFAYGIKRISAIQAMLTATLEPILNPVWVLAVTGEKPSVPALIGGGIIIASVVFSSAAGKAGKPEHPQRKDR